MSVIEAPAPPTPKRSNDFERTVSKPQLQKSGAKEADDSSLSKRKPSIAVFERLPAFAMRYALGDKGMIRNPLRRRATGVRPALKPRVESKATHVADRLATGWKTVKKKGMEAVGHAISHLERTADEALAERRNARSRAKQQAVRRASETRERAAPASVSPAVSSLQSLMTEAADDYAALFSLPDNLYVTVGSSAYIPAGRCLPPIRKTRKHCCRRCSPSPCAGGISKRS
jgi:hypothetical protein